METKETIIRILLIACCAGAVLYALNKRNEQIECIMKHGQKACL
jgi:hypothetical protein